MCLSFGALSVYMKHLIFSAVFFFISFVSYSQDFDFGKPSPEEFALKNYAKDTSANAVVLREFGNAHVSNSDGNIVFEYHVRIKIFNSKAFKYGDISVPLRKSDANTFEAIRLVRGVTFYRDDEGLLRKTELDSKQIFRETKVSRFHDLTKFAMPNLREGCIVEYSYEISSPFIFNFRTWEFQWSIPNMHSEFNAHIPAVYNYNVALRGPYKLTSDKAVLEKECFQPGGGFKADCSNITYLMKDVPAFIEEDNMTAASNFISAVYFELSDYVDYHGVKHQITKEWKDVDHELKTSPGFGLQLRKKDLFREQVAKLTAGQTDAQQKAKAIFSFMQGWFKWNNYNGKYSDDGLKKAFESHTGNSGDINLCLVNAMVTAGLSAEPVILSTRSNGAVNMLFPVMSNFDYVVCKVNINDTYYLLDATDPLLPFGLLPLRCINDKGRVMCQDKPSYWIDLKASQKASKRMSIIFDMDESSKIKGSIIIYSSGYEAYAKRRSIRKFNSTEEYTEDLDERMPKIKILKAEIANLDTLDKVLKETYEVELAATNTDNPGFLYFNPFLMNLVSENPYKLAERSYPVDLGAASESSITVQVNIPEGYELYNKPEDVGLALPLEGGRFISRIAVDSGSITFMQNTLLNKSVYSPSEYLYLKELYNKIVLNQQSQIVLKKKI